MNRLITSLIQLGICLFACVSIALIKSYYRDIRAEQKAHELSRRIVYCDGKKSDVVHIVMVDNETFWSFDIEQQPYGLIDRNTRSIYLDVSTTLKHRR